MSDDWQKQVDWMRRNGVVSAQWGDSGSLLQCILGPEVSTSTEPLSADAYKLQLDDEKRRAKEVEDQRDFGAA